MPNGLYCVKRLLSVTPLIFQRYMDTVLSSLCGVCIYLDDILIAGSTEQEHTERPQKVLS